MANRRFFLLDNILIATQMLKVFNWSMDDVCPIGSCDTVHFFIVLPKSIPIFQIFQPFFIPFRIIDQCKNFASWKSMSVICHHWNNTQWRKKLLYKDWYWHLRSFSNSLLSGSCTPLPRKKKYKKKIVNKSVQAIITVVTILDDTFYAEVLATSLKCR